MVNLGISKDRSRNRVSHEKRNVYLPDAYLYAIKRESDNDYHLIIGTRAGSPNFNTEISGLPDRRSRIFRILQRVRDVVENRFGVLCNNRYHTFSPGIPVEVGGSLFFDVDHSAGAVEPLRYKPETTWEIHPVTRFVFID